jgi:hypothetical protein
LPVIQRTGAAEIIASGESVATGTYEATLDQTVPTLGTGRTSAKGVIRLRFGQNAHRAMTGRSVRVRFDWRVELPVEVTLYVPAAGFIAFTCSDASPIVSE